MKKQRSEDELSFLEIDIDALDEEWVGQPKRFGKYAKKLADAKHSVEVFKANLALVEAELADAIRRIPKEFGVTKTTKDAVDACVIQQREYKEALEELNNAKHKADVYDAAVKSLDHRKKALENLVFLHGQNYFASPRSSGEGREVTKEYERRSANKKISRALKRREEDEDE